MTNQTGADLFSVIDKVVIVLGWIFGALVFLYNRWAPFYLFGNRVRLWALNKTALWKVRVDYTGSFDSSAFDRLALPIKDIWPDLKRRVISPNSLTLQAEGMLIEIDIDYDASDRVIAAEESGSRATATTTAARLAHRLVLTFQDIRAPYREAAALVDRICALTERMSREIAATDATHSAIIRFPERNPYFGLFVARLPRDQVKAFQCVLAPESDAPQDQRASRVTIGRDSIEIWSSNAVEWARLSKRYLAAR